MLYNPYFTQMLNPAYLDVLDCPYLNYAKSPLDVNDRSVLRKRCSTVPEQNVSDFIDALKYDWESLPKKTKDEYYAKLAEMIHNKNIVENFEDSKPDNTLYIVYFLIIILIGTVAYYFSHI